jgi:hypothetical protein
MIPFGRNLFSGSSVCVRFRTTGNTLKQHKEILRKMFEIHCRRVKFLDPRPLIESPNTSHCPSQASQSHECGLPPCDSLRMAGPARESNGPGPCEPWELSLANRGELGILFAGFPRELLHTHREAIAILLLTL